MSLKVYIGKPSKDIGKTVFEILANLKNFGVGRMLTKNEWNSYTEPSYHIIKRVQTYMDPELKYGTIWCETVIRGKRLPGIRPIGPNVTYKPDFRLIPKDEEEQFIGGYPIKDLADDKNILPKYYQLPPLMQEWLNRNQVSNLDFIDNNETNNKPFMIPFIYQNIKDLQKPNADLFWVANKLSENMEKPTVSFDGKFHFNDEYLKYCSQ